MILLDAGADILKILKEESWRVIGEFQISRESEIDCLFLNGVSLT